MHSQSCDALSGPQDGEHCLLGYLFGPIQCSAKLPMSTAIRPLHEGDVPSACLAQLLPSPTQVSAVISQAAHLHSNSCHSKSPFLHRLHHSALPICSLTDVWTGQNKEDNVGSWPVHFYCLCTYKEKETERKFFPSLVHSPNSHNSRN